MEQNWLRREEFRSECQALIGNCFLRMFERGVLLKAGVLRGSIPQLCEAPLALLSFGPSDRAPLPSANERAHNLATELSLIEIAKLRRLSLPLAGVSDLSLY